MNKIYKSTVDRTFPQISTILYFDKECMEHLCLERNVIGFILSGTKRIVGIGEVCSGEMYVIPMGNYLIKYKAGECGFYEEVFINFTSEQIYKIINLLSDKLNIVSLLSNKLDNKPLYSKEKCEDFLANIFKYIKEQNDFDIDEKTKKLFWEISFSQIVVTIILGNYSSSKQKLLSIMCQSEDEMSILMNSFTNNTPTKICDIAKRCGLTDSKYKNLFGKIYGLSPHKWTLDRQLQSAFTMIESSDMMIKEIAELNNFNDASHLIKYFKKRYGVTPLQYRKRLKNNK